MKFSKLKNILVPFLAAALLALFCYGAYALYYEFDFYPESFLFLLYLEMMSVVFGVFTSFFVSHFTKKKLPLILSGVSGAIAVNAIFWAVNFIINSDFLHNDNVIENSFSVLFPMTGIVLFAAFVVRAKKKSRIINSLLALIYFAVTCVGGFIVNEERIEESKYRQTINFDTVSAEKMSISSAEKQRCREWFDENVLLKGKTTIPIYDFKIGKTLFSKDIENYTKEIAHEQEEIYRGGKTYTVIFSHKTNGMLVTVEATLYEENATCEWTVFVKNVSDKNTENITDFYAFDGKVETGNADVYYSRGSVCKSSDFALVKKSLSIKRVFGCSEGRSSLDFMPYFNISGEEKGYVLGIGWTGEWEALMKCSGDASEIKVKQQSLDAYLLPYEEIRSPLVSLSFYDGENPLKGFNNFRSFVTDCVYPENIPSAMTMMEVAGPMSTSTTDQIFDTMNTFGKEIFDNVDYFWMDAGWYKYEEGWYDSVGTWKPDTERYDNGIIEISDYGKERGCGLTLWYEPERVYAGSQLDKVGKANEQWLVTNGGDLGMWNLANDDACDYLSRLIADSLKENGVAVYRQDFNYDIKSFWEKADREYYDGRVGICENHYITNLYKYLDYLLLNVDGLIMDNCASGGRRLDLEMTRRSVPVWRSDYNCAPHDDILEATQAQTYNLSFWLPITGTLRYSETEYSSRTGIMPCTVETFGTVHSPDFSSYTEQREMMIGNFYPIECGGYASDKILAMQYSTKDAKSGEALVYKRAEVKDTEYTLKLNGLLQDSVYNVYDFDNPEKIYTMTGEELMTNGMKLSLPDGEKAMIIMFSAEK